MTTEDLRDSALLGPADVRMIADALGVRPTKVLGQNFVHDAGTVRRIVRAGGVTAGDSVVEVGPGLGSLTLALLEVGAYVTAVEIDPPLAAALPQTIIGRMPWAASRLRVLLQDATTIMSMEDFAGAVPVETAAPTGADASSGSDAMAAQASSSESGVSAESDDGVKEGVHTDGVHTVPGEWPVPTKLVANLPYNVAVPVLLTMLENIPTLTDVLVMVQAEVADRLAASPGSRTYGVPSVKAAWYGKTTRVGTIGRTVFWPEPNVDSALVHVHRGPSRGGDDLREATFQVIDAAFGQRRKTLRAALKPLSGSAAEAEKVLMRAGIPCTMRGEALGINEFVALGQAILDLRADGDLQPPDGYSGRSYKKSHEKNRAVDSHPAMRAETLTAENSVVDSAGSVVAEDMAAEPEDKVAAEHATVVPEGVAAVNPMGSMTADTSRAEPADA